MPRATTSSHLRGRHEGGRSGTARGSGGAGEGRSSQRDEFSRGGFDIDRGEPSGREGSEEAGRTATAGRHHDVRKERGGGLTESDRPESVGKSHSSGKSSPATEAHNDGSRRRQHTILASNEHLSEENDDYEPAGRPSR